jgi:hypothetical protein
MLTSAGLHRAKIEFRIFLLCPLVPDCLFLCAVMELQEPVQILMGLKEAHKVTESCYHT